MPRGAAKTFTRGAEPFHQLWFFQGLGLAGHPKTLSRVWEGL